jgi:putative PEP-CTERM system histidine kinase
MEPMAAVVSHALAAAGYLALAALLWPGWRQGRHPAPLLAACALTGLWAAVVVLAYLTAGPDGMPGRAVLRAAESLEALRSTVWVACLMTMLTGRDGQSPGPAGVQPHLHGIWLLAGVAALALLPLAVGPLYGAAPPALALGCRLLLAVLGLLLLEQLYRATPAHERWGIKYACLGVGVLFAYDFYLYSDGLLFQRLNGDLLGARGLVNALGAPLLAISAARSPRRALGLALSRQMLFGSAALIGSAVYLLAMAACAWYLRRFGGAWGVLVQMAWLAGAAIVLAGVLFSGAARAYAKVFISKHFYQSDFDYREEWQRFTRALSLDGPELGQRAVQAIAALVESPGGALWLRSEDGGCVPAASWNLPRQQDGADVAFCRFLENRVWVLDVSECLARPERYAGLSPPNWLAGMAQAWLVVPLMLHGRLHGLVALTAPRAGLALDWEMRDLLKLAGSQAASYLAHRTSTDALAVARQFESFNRMSAFIVHDLKNLVSQLSLLLTNAERHQGNPEFQQDMLATLAHSVRKMTLLLHKLSRGEGPEQPAPLALAEVLAQAVRARAAARPCPSLDVLDGGLDVLADRQRLERVLGHLIQNAIEATPADGKVALSLRREGLSAVIELSDSGHGMSEQFIRERLFKPFDSTKPAGMGIGVFESRDYLCGIGGRLEVNSAPGQGSTFRIILPLHQAAAAAA